VSYSGRIGLEPDRHYVVSTRLADSLKLPVTRKASVLEAHDMSFRLSPLSASLPEYSWKHTLHNPSSSARRGVLFVELRDITGFRIEGDAQRFEIGARARTGVTGLAISDGPEAESTHVRVSR